MSLILSGTDGLSDVDGSAATPAIRGTDANTGIFFPAADTIAFSEGGVEAMRIDSSGNVGIGSTTARNLEVTRSDANTTYGSTAAQFPINVRNTDTTANNWAVIGFNQGPSSYANPAYVGAQFTSSSAAALTFGTSSTERMRIDSAGEVLIGGTAPQPADGLVVKGKRTATSSQWNFQVWTNAGQATLLCRDDYYMRSPAIYDRTAGSAANVTIDSSGYLYRSTSSLKYKRDVIDYDKGISTVMQLRPVYYKSKVNDPDGNPVNTQYAGMIAEELDDLGLDEFVVKNNDGEVEAIHYGNMVALLTKTIQEQQALIQSLTTRITALETP